MKHPHVSKFIREQPWAIQPATLLAILELLELREAGVELERADIEARIANGPGSGTRQTAAGVAVLPIYGVITPRADLFSDVSGGTSLETFRAQLDAAVNDRDVTAIVLDVNSPGGSTDLGPETAAAVRAARGVKPVVAIANTLAASAAYHLASQASELYVTPSGHAGSIGVFTAHDDLSKMREELGVKTTLISAGRYKVDGNPFEPLSDSAREHLQGLVDSAYSLMVRDIAAGRGVDEARVREGFGEGRALPAAAALREGMVDGVQTFEQTVGTLIATGETGRVAALSGWALDSELLELEVLEGDFPVELLADAIPPHSTATSDGPFDGPANEARLRLGGSEAYYRSAFAWQDPAGDPETKAAYRFIHHDVAGNGDVGPANVRGCRAGIGVLNGARGGTTIPAGDKRGVYNHLARHMRDAGVEPPEYRGEAPEHETFSDAVEDALRAVDAVVTEGGALRALTRRKREELAALGERLEELLATCEPASPADLRDDDHLEAESAIAEARARLQLSQLGG